MICTLWILLTLLFIIFEIFIPSVCFFICLSIGSLCAGIVSAYWQHYICMNIDLITFVMMSIISLFCIRPIFVKFIKNELMTNVDALINTKAIVTIKITPYAIGWVKTDNELWRAKANIEIDVGSIVTIRSVDGTTLNVDKTA
ncbi:MAG: NfeD family protein [Endomicrobium sp.]|nr:NfeD family protein [Endomicrobium sp.]